jgi:AraC-like DNA-binding protein
VVTRPKVCARDTLRAPLDTQLGEDALQVDFTVSGHFTRHFVRIVGVTPGAWRRALKE